ncbi:hypothetical protein B484DRAFT_457602 [Ochromonadaceae sp. CCMP2298]|nr:hypothetical protein B484DRAFT_457602 [Ochromonadaceae sp. CCMP2298]
MGGGMGRGAGVALTQQALSAVNAASALAPSKVEELDLGLGLGPDTGDAGVVGATPLPPPGAQGVGGEAKTGTAVEGGGGASAALYEELLRACPLHALSEEAPAESAYELMLGLQPKRFGGAGGGPLSVAAGRVPSSPPVQ